MKLGNMITKIFMEGCRQKALCGRTKTFFGRYRALRRDRVIETLKCQCDKVQRNRVGLIEILQSTLIQYSAPRQISNSAKGVAA